MCRVESHFVNYLYLDFNCEMEEPFPLDPMSGCMWKETFMWKSFVLSVGPKIIRWPLLIGLPVLQRKGFECHKLWESRQGLWVRFDRESVVKSEFENEYFKDPDLRMLKWLMKQSVSKGILFFFFFNLFNGSNFLLIREFWFFFDKVFVGLALLLTYNCYRIMLWGSN